MRAALLALVVLPALVARADEVVRAKGKTLEGFVTRRGDVVRVNPYGSSAPSMTWGVVEVPADEVVEVLPDRGPGTIHRAFLELAPDDVAQREALLDAARDHRLRAEARRLAEEILRVQPDHRAALAVVGGAEDWAVRRRGDPALDPDLALALHRAVRQDDAWARRAAAREIEAAYGYPARPEVVERMARAYREAPGERPDERLHQAVGPRGDMRYALLVPPDADAVLPRPLLVALHDGAPEGGPVTGTAGDALELVRREATRRGWFVAAPQAGPEGWRDAPAVVDALVDEVGLRLHVDLDRVYVFGQGTGADAALVVARTLARSFAGVGLAGASEPRGATALVTRGLGVWLYQGEADDVVPVARAREAADRLEERRGEAVYCELPGGGHVLAAEGEADLFRFLAGRRRREDGRSAWPRSSFAGPVLAWEAEAFGDPRAAWGQDLAPDTAADDLWARLAGGGATAEAAARALVERGAAEEPRLVRVLADPAVPFPGRRWAAWALGARAAPDGAGAAPPAEVLQAVGAAVRQGGDVLLATEAARAVSRLPGASAALRGDLLEALEACARDLVPRAGEAAVPFARFERAARLASALVDALGRSVPPAGPAPGAGAAEVAAAIEAAVVVPVLRTAPPVDARAERGEDPSATRAALARSAARAYARLAVETTRMDLLRSATRRSPSESRAAEEGYAEGSARGS